MKEPYDLSEHSKTVDYMLEKTARENSKVAGQFKDEYFHLANTHTPYTHRRSRRRSRSQRTSSRTCKESKGNRSDQLPGRDVSSHAHTQTRTHTHTHTFTHTRYTHTLYTRMYTHTRAS
jgi:hypothetical protein